MSSIPVNLAVEDELSEAVLRRLLKHADRGYSIGTAYRRGGYGYLKRTIGGWNQAARSVPFVVLTDLDDAVCPAELIGSWLKGPAHPNLIFRIAVREVESWLLADPDGLASYLKVKLSSLPTNPDRLGDPKAAIIDLAKESRSRDIKSSLVPRKQSTAKQGPDYNNCLSMFVDQFWDIDFAASNSDSLSRSLAKLLQFKPTWV